MSAQMIDDGDPAFPFEQKCPEDGQMWHAPGMTLRQYAAIKLKVPNSGTDWLDQMIRESLRDWFAASVAPNIISLSLSTQGDWDETTASVIAYEVADAMLKARSE